MKRNSDDLSIALEELRNRPIVTESRDYARRWERSSTRAASFRSVLSAGALAAACVLAGMALWVLPGFFNSSARNLLETRIGETRVVRLDDGSRILLDTASHLRVAFTAAARDVTLLDGQAHFEVAKDARRPFHVRTGSADIVAVGTMFDVAALAEHTTVTLIEGRVNVRTITDTPRILSMFEAMTPGEQLDIAGDGQFLGRRTVKIETATAWERGTIVLDDMRVSDALAALNRYSATRIVIADPELQSRRVSGVFRTGDVETETLALQRYFGLRESSRSARQIVLKR